MTYEIEKNFARKMLAAVEPERCAQELSRLIPGIKRSMQIFSVDPHGKLEPELVQKEDITLPERDEEKGVDPEYEPFLIRDLQTILTILGLLFGTHILWTFLRRNSAR